MNSNNSDDLNKLFWELIEDESIDDTDEELLMTMLEREQQSKSSIRPKQKRKVIDRSREEGHGRLFRDYFSENPVYTDAQFRRRFRMRRHVFL
jgi:hypothetical protein